MKRVVVAVIMLAFFTFYYFYLTEYITFAALKAYQHTLQSYVDTYYLRSVVLYILSYALTVALSLPVAVLLTLLGGSLFGALWGTVYAVTGATMGATLAFLLVRYVAGESLQERYRERLLTFNAELEKRGIYYLLSLRLFAIIPFFVLNIVAGLTNISLATFIGTTFVGILPGTFVFAYAGQRLGSLTSPGDILSGQVLMAFALLGILALVPVVLRKRERA